MNEWSVGSKGEEEEEKKGQKGSEALYREANTGRGKSWDGGMYMWYICRYSWNMSK